MTDQTVWMHSLIFIAVRSHFIDVMAHMSLKDNRIPVSQFYQLVANVPAIM